ncbi:hypothetical protein KHC28_00110 [Ancylobacter sonchi]|uniref:hypothetical protein n=1 Tax=Ancylobacter sonchi TaxID=1937790 RepID=UPI001BD24E3E|nr:hypothetical protein [Ancylobacter sonchi]MBS7532068.1 hypothetical protein [Ancylobacter sonchi]
MRNIQFDMDPELPEGTGIISNGWDRAEQVQVPPTSPLPEWVTKVTLSVEDYGRMLAARAQPSR